MVRLFIASLTLICLFGAPAAPQKKSFEGTINYTITYLELPPEVQGMESMLPSSISMSFKGDNVRLEQGVMGGSQIILANNQTKESHVLMDMMGQKIDVYVDKATMEAEEAKMEKPVIELIKEFKDILNYKCQKAIIKQAGQETEVWFTKKIQAVHTEYKELPGFPLEYVSTQNGMKLRMTASAVDKKEISDALFKVPEGYTTMTLEELQSLGGN